MAGPTARSPVGHGWASLGGPRLSGRQIAGIPTSTAGPRTPGQAKDSLTITGGLGPADGCSLWLINAQSGKVLWHVADSLYGTSIFQVKYTGTFRWRVNEALRT